MLDFDYFVLTRFNADVGYGKRGLDPEWLDLRFRLFEWFCASSVRGQSNQRFKWLVFFDIETPDRFKANIEEYSTYQNFIPIYVRGKCTDRTYREAILQHLDPNAQYLITTRLDNDDAICQDYIQTVRDKFEAQALQFINFTYGYVWHDRKAYIHAHASNSFISLIEKIQEPTADGFKTVFCGVSHGQVNQVGPLVQVKTKPMWIRVAHGKNIINNVRGIRQPIAKLKEDFTISPECFPDRENLLLCHIDRGISTLMMVPRAMAKPKKLWKTLKAIVSK